MPVIAVVNRKGGSGKSTLATNLAAYCASRGILAMLGDVDRQQSTQTWLRLRADRTLPHSAPILGWAVDPKNVLRSPPGTTHVILDTPGGLRGFDLARVVGYADVILMPVCNSVFDRESAAECHAELLALPRVASGRCKVAAIGMRLDARTRAAEVMQAWADTHEMTYLGALRETQAYVRCVEQGLGLFDLPAAKATADLAQWAPILAWLEPVLRRPAPGFAAGAGAGAGMAPGSAEGALDGPPSRVDLPGRVVPVADEAPASTNLAVDAVPGSARIGMGREGGMSRPPTATRPTSQRQAIASPSIVAEASGDPPWPRPQALPGAAVAPAAVAAPTTALPRDHSPEALARAALATLTLPANLGVLSSPTSLKRRLGRWLGALQRRPDTANL